MFHCISSIYHLLMHFFEEYVRIKIEEHKIFILTSILSLNLAEVNASYTYNIIQSCLTLSQNFQLYVLYTHFIIFLSLVVTELKVVWFFTFFLPLEDILGKLSCNTHFSEPELLRVNHHVTIFPQYIPQRFFFSLE